MGTRINHHLGHQPSFSKKGTVSTSRAANVLSPDLKKKKPLLNYQECAFRNFKLFPKIFYSKATDKDIFTQLSQLSPALSPFWGW